MVQIGLKIGRSNSDLEMELTELIKSDPSIGYLDTKKGTFVRGESISKRSLANDKLENMARILAQSIENWNKPKRANKDAESISKEDNLIPQIQSFIEEIMIEGGVKPGEEIRKFDEKRFPPMDQKRLEPIFLFLASEIFSQFRTLIRDKTWFNAGFIAQNFSWQKEAKLFYTTSLELRPSFAEARMHLGYILIETKVWQEAQEAFEECLNQTPNDVDAWRGLGIVRRNQSDLTGAIDALKKALELNPKNANAWCELGFTLRAQGEVSEALQAYERALKLDLNSPEIWERVGIAMKKFGWDEQALYCWERSMELGHTLWGKWIGQLRKRGVKPMIPEFLEKS